MSAAAKSAPEASAAVVLGLAALPALAYYQANFAGYAGKLPLERVLVTLQDEDALLVDIRDAVGPFSSSLGDLLQRPWCSAAIRV